MAASRLIILGVAVAAALYIGACDFGWAALGWFCLAPLFGAFDSTPYKRAFVFGVLFGVTIAFAGRSPAPIPVGPRFRARG